MYRLIVIIVIIFFVSCQSGTKTQVKTNENEEKTVMMEDTLNIRGMHCDMCEQSIEKGVNELEGISFVKASLNDSTAVVKFDTSKTDLAQIEKAIEKRGYIVKRDL